MGIISRSSSTTRNVCVQLSSVHERCKGRTNAMNSSIKGDSLPGHYFEVLANQRLYDQVLLELNANIEMANQLTMSVHNHDDEGIAFYFLMAYPHPVFHKKKALKLLYHIAMRLQAPFEIPQSIQPIHYLLLD